MSISTTRSNIRRAKANITNLRKKLSKEQENHAKTMKEILKTQKEIGRTSSQSMLRTKLTKLDRLNSTIEFSKMLSSIVYPHLSQWFNKLVKSTELPVIRFHDLRHTHATLLLQAGVNPKVVSERLGHTNITITLNTYSHVVPHMQDEAAQKFEQMILKQVK